MQPSKRTSRDSKIGDVNKKNWGDVINAHFVRLYFSCDANCHSRACGELKHNARFVPFASHEVLPCKKKAFSATPYYYLIVALFQYGGPRNEINDYRGQFIVFDVAELFDIKNTIRAFHLFF